MKSRNVSFGLAVGIALAALVFAGTREAAAQTAGDKAIRGAVGMTCGFLELPGNIHDTSVKDGAVKGWTLGFMKGIAMMPLRTLVGVYEFVTFPIAAPDNFAPVLNPGTPFGYWNSSMREQSLAVNPPPPVMTTQQPGVNAPPSAVTAQPYTEEKQ